jgi:hypothetical protein
MLANEPLFVSAMLLIPVLFALDIVHGRLVHAVYGLRIHTPAIAELAVALFHGASSPWA